MVGRVCIKNLEVFAHHGLFKEEQAVGRKFIVNTEITVDFSKAALTDEIDGTVNYAEVCDIIHAQMAQPSKLLEHVGHRIVAAIKSAYPLISKVVLSIAKTNPPIKGKIEAVCIEIEQTY